ncbi:hypothetical protein M3650_30550 [Paenibacillus sp. MER TA 81-3]|uniref:hypothetical protein n=1 Tax=Paenibacillus sp. MER TA 81-3 TaxID=2939573 RepID=UPI00203B5AF3|nr:hypothetical protein [Paenibacillus sp. MER TA 81-3]MCM3342852.1 hypothetical protein [Paenibacillus sp. MER TA 81-3]
MDMPQKISQGTHILLHIKGLISFPSFSNRAPEFNDCRISLTETGRRVLAGQADWVVMNGMDEWLGGVRLEGRDASWRWDPSTHTLVDSQCR